MELHNLKRLKNKFKSKRIIGRGIGSKKGGHTVGRGMNGQNSRSGGMKKPRVDFEGGQNPISRRLPKLRGFKSAKKANSMEIKLSSLNVFADNTTVDRQALIEKGLVSTNRANTIILYKVISGGELTAKGLKLDGISCTKSCEKYFV